MFVSVMVVGSIPMQVVYFYIFLVKFFAPVQHAVHHAVGIGILSVARKKK